MYHFMYNFITHTATHIEPGRLDARVAEFYRKLENLLGVTAPSTGLVVADSLGMYPSLFPPDVSPQHSLSTQQLDTPFHYTFIIYFLNTYHSLLISDFVSFVYQHQKRC